MIWKQCPISHQEANLPNLISTPCSDRKKSMHWQNRRFRYSHSNKTTTIMIVRKPSFSHFPISQWKVTKQKKSSGFLSKQLDLLGCFSTQFCSKMLIIPSAMLLPHAANTSRHQHDRAVKPDHSPPSHRGALLLSNDFSVSLCLQPEDLWWRTTRKQLSRVHIWQRHFTWFPRKNYNKSGRRGGAEEHKEKETEREWNNKN